MGCTVIHNYKVKEAEKQQNSLLISPSFRYLGTSPQGKLRLNPRSSRIAMRIRQLQDADGYVRHPVEMV